MNYIKGKLKKIIYHNNDSGYVVALFRIKETNDKVMMDKVNKSITVRGIFTDVNIDISMTLYGYYTNNDKFGMQYAVESYEIDIPTTKDGIIEFLASSFIEGCGERTAKKIVDYFGEKTLDIIKENQDNLLKIEGITAIRAAKIHNSLLNYNKSSDAILKFQNLGFTIEECSRIYNKFKDRIDEILGDYFYDLKEIIDFKKVDAIYKNNYSKDNDIRIKACILESMQILSFTNGDTYYYQEEILKVLEKEFSIILSEDVLDYLFDNLVNDEKIYIDGRRIYLMSYYKKELNIANTLKKINENSVKKIVNLKEKLEDLEKKLGIDYNIDQEKAIITALNNNICIISGGPGTGKTTIINAITKLYIEDKLLGPADIMENIALLAPTGRASKKLATSTNLPAYTIHRYLKWYKDSNDFFYNEYNKTNHKLIIVDEVSMIDVDLFNALLNGISSNVKLILVGDTFQLPSVGPGLVLDDLIGSDYFNFVPLNQIYRQSDNSYIAYLAKDIKNNDLSEEFLKKKDDYTFFQTDNSMIKDAIEQIIRISLKKKIDERKMQILAPMYKGENGIDNLNILLQKIYNPPSINKQEIVYLDITYREGDKVLQLLNDLEKNVFNGDIGYIKEINGGNITIDFEGNKVVYTKKDLKQIKHAYAITIHKSQGSEFDFCILPIYIGYPKLFTRNLLYTAMTRAKKKLVIIGSKKMINYMVDNVDSKNRNTGLKQKIINNL